MKFCFRGDRNKNLHIGAVWSVQTTTTPFLSLTLHLDRSNFYFSIERYIFFHWEFSTHTHIYIKNNIFSVRITQRIAGTIYKVCNFLCTYRKNSFASRRVSGASQQSSAFFMIFMFRIEENRRTLCQLLCLVSQNYFLMCFFGRVITHTISMAWVALN